MTEEARPPAARFPGRAVLSTAAVLLVPPIFWGGNLLLQQAHIRSAIRACERDLIQAKDEDDPPAFPKEEVRVLRAAGCRILPRMLDVLEESDNESFKRGCASLLFTLVTKARKRKDAHGIDLCAAAGYLWDSDQHQTGLTEARAWWRTHAAEQHPWWKFWSWKCMAD